MRHLLTVLSAVAGLAVATSASANLDQILQVRQDATKHIAQTQVDIDRISQQTETVVDEYRRVVKQIEDLKIYNRQLRGIVADQERRKASLNDDIANVTQVKRSILPLIEEMTAGLAQTVSADLPFLAEERGERVSKVEDLITDSQVSASEKYRQILNAYEIEAEYGRKMDAWGGEVEIDGIAREVNFVRVGRVGYYYQTPDREVTAAWNRGTGSWETLSGGDKLRVSTAIQMAKNQIQPALFIVPVPAPVEAR